MSIGLACSWFASSREAAVTGALPAWPTVSIGCISELLDRVERMPGVDVGEPCAVLATRAQFVWFPLGLSGGGAKELPALIVYPRYFRTMGIPVVKGRDFSADDLRAARRSPCW